MAKRPTSIFDFFRALAAHWFTAMSGAPSVPLAIAAVFVSTIVIKVLLAVTACFCLMLASYFVWKAEREKVLDLNAQLELLGINQAKSDAKKKLAQFYQQADAFIDAGVSKDLPETEFKEWVDSLEIWFRDVEKWVGETLGPAAKVKLTDLRYQRMSIGKFINKEHLHILNLILKIKLNIEELMKSDAWVDFAPLISQPKERNDY